VVPVQTNSPMDVVKILAWASSQCHVTPPNSTEPPPKTPNTDSDSIRFDAADSDSIRFDATGSDSIRFDILYTPRGLHCYTPVTSVATHTCYK